MLLAGCGKGSAPSAPGGGQAAKRYRVGVTLLKEDDEFYQVMKKAMQDAAAKQAIDLDIQSANNDLKRQTDQIDNFITQQDDAIILCPVNSTGVAGAVKKAAATKIPVFTADIKAEGAPVVCHIASDNRQGGRLVADRLVQLLHGKGNVAIIDFPEVTSVSDRVAGFKEELASKAPAIAIVDDQSGKGERARSADIAANMLLKHGRQLNAIFGINDNTALGAQAAAEQAGRTDLLIVGYDGSKEAVESIHNPKRLLKADAVQYPDRIGTQTINVVVRYLHGDRNIPSSIPVECGIIDK